MLVEASSEGSGLGNEDRGGAGDQEGGRRAGFAEISSIYLYQHPSSGVDSVSIPTPTLRAGDGDLAIISTFQKSQTGSVPWVEPSPSAHCNQIDLSKSIFLGTCCLLKI